MDLSKLTEEQLEAESQRIRKLIHESGDRELIAFSEIAEVTGKGLHELLHKWMLNEGGPDNPVPADFIIGFAAWFLAEARQVAYAATKNPKAAMKALKFSILTDIDLQIAQKLQQLPGIKETEQ